MDHESRIILPQSNNSQRVAFTRFSKFSDFTGGISHLIPSIDKLKNTPCSILTYGYRLVKKDFYFCYCDPAQKELICESCANFCHASHQKIKCVLEISAIYSSCGIKCYEIHVEQDVAEAVKFSSSKCQFYEWSIKSKLFK